MQLLSTILLVVVMVLGQTGPLHAEALELGWEWETFPTKVDAPLRGTVVGSVVSWGEVPLVDGSPDWSEISARIERLRDAGARVRLTLDARHPVFLAQGGLPTPDEGETLEAWLRFVRSATTALGESLEAIQIGTEVPPATDLPALQAYAFALKQSALAVRAAAREIEPQPSVAQATLRGGEVATQRTLWAADVAAYFDQLPLLLSAQDSEAKQKYLQLFSESVLHPPAARIEVILAEDGATEADRLALAVDLLASGASRVRLETKGFASEPAMWWVAGVTALFDQGFGPAPLGALTLKTEAGEELDESRVLGRFLRDEDFSTLVGYLAPAGADGQETVRLRVDSRRVREAYAIDPSIMEGGRLRTASRPGPEGTSTELRAPVGPLPRFVSFRRAIATPGFELPPEDLDVNRTRGLTAEEIIARNQEVDRAQNDHLDRWIAHGRASLHFKFSGGAASIDWTIDGRYFWERGGSLEWEQQVHYVNGNRLPWKKIPEVPQIQPERVITLPLDLTFDKTYSYRLIGEDRVAGREAWLLEFQPTDPDAPQSLYRGRLWVDRESFRTLRTSLIQSGLEAPVRANEERDLFGSFEAVDAPYWLLAEIKGQQIWSIAGRNVIVEREVTFDRYEVNPSKQEFDAAKQAAYASANLILRETDQGFLYMRAGKDGTRTLETEPDSSRLFLAGGVLKDSSTDGVAPLAGVNYFNFDLGGRGWQTDVLFGGLVALGTISKPDLFGGRVDFTAESALFAIRFEDKFFVGDRESTLETVRTRPQAMNLRLGIPLGQFTKLTVNGSLARMDFATEKDAKAELDALNTLNGTSWEHRLPTDHWLTSFGASFSFDRRGYSLVVEGERSARSDWEASGLFDPVGMNFLAFDGIDYLPSADPELFDSFTKWSATLGKEWFLPKFQKLRADVDYLDGSDLDRYSRYAFNFFGDDRLNGFAGSGVRFDSGMILRGGYAFNLLEVIRFEFGLEQARVKTLDGPTQSFEGVGVLANFVGPWKTVINLNFGYALGSDIPGLKGETEVFLLVLKLF